MLSSCLFNQRLFPFVDLGDQVNVSPGDQNHDKEAMLNLLKGLCVSEDIMTSALQVCVLMD